MCAKDVCRQGLELVLLCTGTGKSCARHGSLRVRVVSVFVVVVEDWSWHDGA